MLYGYHKLYNYLKSYKLIISSSVSVLCYGIGSVIGYQSLFGLPNTTFGTIMTILGFGLLVGLILTIFSIIPSYILVNRSPLFFLQILVYSTTTTFIYHTVIGRILSTIIVPANAVLDIIPFNRIAALIGIAGVTFLLVLVNSVIYLSIVISNENVDNNLLPKNKKSNDTSPDLKIHRFFMNSTYVWCLVIVFLLTVIGGFINVSETFYQKNVLDIIPNHYETMSCIFSQYARPGSIGYDQIFNNTETQLRTGNAIVLWSEESIDIRSKDEESELLMQASALAAKYNSGLIGVTYQNRIGVNLYTNHFALITEDGSIAWNYRKAFPVPAVESNVQAGFLKFCIFSKFQSVLSIFSKQVQPKSQRIFRRL